MTKATIEKYNRKADQYEQRWKKYLDHTHRALLERIDLDATDSILDVSGGTGFLVQQIIDHGYSFDRFVINDPSKKMLEVARRRFSDNHKVDFGNEKADQLSYESNSFDKIISLNSFHFYQNQQQVLDRLHLILKPGGKLYLLDWNRSGFFILVNQIIQWSSDEFIDTRSLAELRKMIRKSGFMLENSESWSWRYWRFLFIEAEKS